MFRLVPTLTNKLAHLAQENRRVGFLPDALSTEQTIYLLGQLWPNVNTNLFFDFVNGEVRSGWFDYDASPKPPNTNMSANQLKALFAQQGRFEMNLNEYIVASQDNHLFTNKYLDESPYESLLLGTGVNYGFSPAPVAKVHFLSGLMFLEAEMINYFRTPYLGGRSVGKHYNSTSEVHMHLRGANSKRRDNKVYDVILYINLLFCMNRLSQPN